MTDEKPQDTSFEQQNREFQCTLCDKTFTAAKGLEQHQAVHTGERKHVCQVCGQSFRFKSNLFEHVSVHTGSTPYVCPYCGKECRLKGNLKKHMQTHVTSAKELEAAWKPFSGKRPSAPSADSLPLDRHVDTVSVGGEQNTEAGGGASETPQSVMLPGKIYGLGTAADWTSQIKNDTLLPQIDLDFKMRRLEDTLAENDQIRTMRDLFEFAKPIMCDAFDCPICHASFGTKHDCAQHCQYEHPNVMQNWKHFCEMCFRPFQDAKALRQHEIFHQRVRVFTEEKKNTNSDQPEIMVPMEDELDEAVAQHLQLQPKLENQKDY